MNSKGFISTSVIYGLLIVFLLMLSMLLYIYTSSRQNLNIHKNDLKEELVTNDSAEYPKIRITRHYETGYRTGVYNIIDSSSIDVRYYYLDKLLSGCDNGIIKVLDNGEVTVETTGKAVCNFYYTIWGPF